MPPRIDLNKCNGCGGKPETACEMVCPGDLMMLDPETGKARCRATGECWDCMSCIKVCPTGALQTRMPYQLLLQGQPAPHHGQGLHHLEMP